MNFVFILLFLPSMNSDKASDDGGEHVAPYNSCEIAEKVGCHYPLPLLTGQFDLLAIQQTRLIREICPSIKDSLNCARDFAKRCSEERDSEYRNHVIERSGAMIDDICKERSVAVEDLISHMPCIIDSKPIADQCLADFFISATILSDNWVPADGNITDEYKKRLCCAFHRKTKCVEEVLHKLCDPNDVSYTKMFDYNLTVPYVEGVCQVFEEEKADCPSESSSYIHSTEAVYFGYLMFGTFILASSFK